MYVVREQERVRGVRAHLLQQLLGHCKESTHQASPPCSSPAVPASLGGPIPLPAWHGVARDTPPVAPVPLALWGALTTGVRDSQLLLHAREARVSEGGLVSSHSAVPLAVALLGDPAQSIWSHTLCRDMRHGPMGRAACPSLLGISQQRPRDTGTAQWWTCATLCMTPAPFLSQTILAYLYGVLQCSRHHILVCPAGIVHNLQNKWPGWILVDTAA